MGVSHFIHQRQGGQGCAILTKVGFDNSSVFFSVSFFRKASFLSPMCYQMQPLRQHWTPSISCWKDRIYTPLVTLWVFLGQVLSADHSCRAAVARLIAHRISQGQKCLFCEDRRLLPS